ncbi:hypothetical protein ACJMK2_015488 [Sinanodonta woodiana]|uniref:Sushi domain-containing protein n=1 Tax=Sinanodonta woodiana TaxID=1069815 RepID=A0ABD3UQJ3_SINWO
MITSSYIHVILEKTVTCPKSFSGGNWISCQYRENETCSYICISGFHKDSHIQNATCGADGAWNRNTEKLCRRKCDIGIPKAILNSSCSLEIGEECNFECAFGFKAPYSVNKVKCQKNGEWAPAQICKEINCPTTIPNGAVSLTSCNRRIYSQCEFMCNQGFDPNPKHNKVSCGIDGKWLETADPFCLKRKGLCINYLKHGRWVKGCQFRQNDTCAFECDGGFSKLSNLTRNITCTSSGEWDIDLSLLCQKHNRGLIVTLSPNFGVVNNHLYTLPTIHDGTPSLGSILSHHFPIDVQIHSVDGDYALGHAYVYDHYMKTIYGNSNFSFGISECNKWTILHRGLSKDHVKLAVDWISHNIYWTDPQYRWIAIQSLLSNDTSMYRILIHNNLEGPHGLADYLYVTDIFYGKLHFFNKTTGEELHESLSREGETYFGITVFDPDAQPTSATDHCHNYGCEHICVTDKDGAICLCKEGYTLNKDMKTCSVNNQYFHRGLVFSNKSSICIVDIRVVTDFSYDPNCVLKTSGTKYMVLDTDQRQVIFANDTAIYSARINNLDLHQLTEQSGKISGLAWDGLDRKVYWSEMNTGKIWRLSIKTYTADVFLDGLISPRDILILQHERRLYWISDRKGSTIESSSFDGSNHKIVLNSEDLVNPKSLTYDPHKKRIYFLDITAAGTNYIYSCKQDGSDLNSFVSTEINLEKMEIYRGHLLVTAEDADRTLIISYSTELEEATTSGVFIDAGNISAIKVFDENVRQNETGPCFNLHGDCEQICISNGKTRICECAFGFKLGRNGKNCTADPIDDIFMLVGDRTHNKIYQINLTDQSVQGINAIGTNSLTGVSYSPVHNQIIWGTEEPKVSIIHLNSTREKIFSISRTHNSHYYPYRFAVDYSTGNIYYTAVNKRRSLVRRQNYIGVLSTKGKHKVLVTGLSFPHGIVVYPSKGLLFYADGGFGAHIGKSNMDGSEPAVLLDIRMEWPTELTIDYKNEYLYWIDHFDDSIRYCKLDGTGHKKLIEYPKAGLQGLALYEDYLYISAKEHSNLRKVNRFRPNDTTEFATHGELGRIQSINIYSSAYQNKNSFCSNGNGGCSTFCFPTPDGGVCDCEDDVDLVEGSENICSNAPQCPEILKQIIVSSDCQRVTGSNCTFTCMQGYVARQNVDSVFCNGEKYTPIDACEAITCPEKFSHGMISSTCDNRVGQTCGYECTEYGYEKNEKISTIKCTESGTWNIDTGILCQLSTAPKSEPDTITISVENTIAVIVFTFIIVIILIIILFIRKRIRILNINHKRLEEEVTSRLDMVANTSFGPEINRAYSHVTYENGAVHINSASKTEETVKSSLPHLNTF